MTYFEEMNIFLPFKANNNIYITKLNELESSYEQSFNDI